MAVTVDFDTTPFVASHGKEPKGYGQWCFGTKRNIDVMKDDECFWSPAMTYGDAKKWAKREIAKRFGTDATGTLYVQS